MGQIKSNGISVWLDAKLNSMDRTPAKWLSIVNEFVKSHTNNVRSFEPDTNTVESIFTAMQLTYRECSANVLIQFPCKSHTLMVLSMLHDNNSVPVILNLSMKNNLHRWFSIRSLKWKGIFTWRKWRSFHGRQLSAHIRHSLLMWPWWQHYRRDVPIWSTWKLNLHDLHRELEFGYLLSIWHQSWRSDLFPISQCINSPQFNRLISSTRNGSIDGCVKIGCCEFKFESIQGSHAWKYGYKMEY